MDYNTYITLAGDTFDILALDFYNDEAKATRIIQANPQYCGVLVFDAGIALKIPLVQEAAPASLPPWRR